MQQRSIHGWCQYLMAIMFLRISRLEEGQMIRILTRLWFRENKQRSWSYGFLEFSMLELVMQSPSTCNAICLIGTPKRFVFKFASFLFFSFPFQVSSYDIYIFHGGLQSQIRRKSKETIRKAYLGARAKVKETQRSDDETWRVGSASVMVINGEKLVIANMGDYRAVVCRDGVAHQMGSKHQLAAKRYWSRRLFSGIKHLQRHPLYRFKLILLSHSSEFTQPCRILCFFICAQQQVIIIWV